jgi:hypothetical protein
LLILAKVQGRKLIATNVATTFFSSRDDKTAIELFIVGVLGWEPGFRRRVDVGGLPPDRLLPCHRFSQFSQALACGGIVDCYDSLGLPSAIGSRLFVAT